jgi:hypothetical protein
MKTTLLDALNTQNSGSPKNPDSDLDEEMCMERGSDEENSEEVLSHDSIFGIWNLNIKESSDEEIGLIKDLKKILSNVPDTNINASTVSGTADGERLNSELGGNTKNVDELVADLGNLSLNQVEGLDDKIFKFIFSIFS